MNVKEEVVAVIERGSIDGEKRLENEICNIEFQAESIVIDNEDDYKIAGEFGRFLKSKASDVTEFFKPLKEAAHLAHKQICSREKEMLTPLKNAEKVLKKSMSEYAMEIERKKKEEEARLKRLAEEEAQRKLEEAVKLEQSGDAAGAENLLADAQVTEQLSKTIIGSKSKAPKVDGVSTRTDWEIIDVDSKAVPTEFAGIEIRPVNTSALMSLIRSSNGSISIPGVKYKEVTKMSFRR